MCMMAECPTAPRAEPIGQAVLQKSLPEIADQTMRMRKDTIPAIMPAEDPTPREIHDSSTASGRTTEAMLRIMFQGSTMKATEKIPKRRQRI